METKPIVLSVRRLAALLMLAALTTATQAAASTVTTLAFCVSSVTSAFIRTPTKEPACQRTGYCNTVTLYATPPIGLIGSTRV